MQIAYGQTVAGSISTAGEADTFLFSGQADDQITLQLSRTSGQVDPQVRISCC